MSYTFTRVTCRNLNKTERKHVRDRPQAGRELRLGLKRQRVRAGALAIRSPTATPAAWRNWGHSLAHRDTGLDLCGNRKHGHGTRPSGAPLPRGAQSNAAEAGLAEQAAGRGLCRRGSRSWTPTRELRSPPPVGLRPQRPHGPSLALSSELTTQKGKTKQTSNIFYDHTPRLSDKERKPHGWQANMWSREQSPARDEGGHAWEGAPGPARNGPFSFLNGGAGHRCRFIIIL